MNQHGLSPEEIEALLALRAKEQEARPASFPTMDPAAALISGESSPLGLLAHVQLEVTVELGKTRRTIKEILTMGPGSVLELDRLAGEAVDILVNGSPVARGEVVVIGENFGVRITELVHPSAGGKGE